MTTTTEEIVQKEQQAYDEAQQTDQPEDDTTDETDGKALFDRSQYETEGLAITKIDGQPVDRIAVKFTGEVMLDRSSEADVALFNKLRLGADVELRIAGTVQRSSGAGATSRDGDLDVVVGQKTIKVGTVWVLAPENLTV